MNDFRVLNDKYSQNNSLLLHEESLSVGHIVQSLDVALVKMEVNDTVEIRLQTFKV